MARSNGSHFVITANRTLDGAAVYLTADDGWTESLNEAQAVVSDDDRNALLAMAIAQENVVCNPYAMSVNLEAERPISLSTREWIRSGGPTIAYGHRASMGVRA